MGKTTIIGGKYIENVKGDKKIYAGGNISFDSGKKLVQHGEEEGIVYGEPKTLHKHNTSNPQLKVKLNLFFDGTRNNKNNTQARLNNNTVYDTKGNKKDDSYENDFSNIVRGYDALDPNEENQVKVYIEGIGTVDDKADDHVLGPGLGEGDRGIRAKATKGCLKSAKILWDKYKQNPKIDIIEVNVFGFSRGAAAARYFVHIASSPCLYTKSLHHFEKVLLILPHRVYGDNKNKNEIFNPFFYIKNTQKNLSFIEKYGYFGACLLKVGLQVKEIKFNFAGLYDTVASFGLDHRGNYLANSDAKQLYLDAVKKCNFTLQLASRDEYRENFSLTNINSCGLNGLELTLPGVHSDIGGGYVNGAEEIAFLLKDESYDFRQAKLLASFLIYEGWFNGNNQLYIVNKKEDPVLFYSIEYKKEWGLNTYKLAPAYKVSLLPPFYLMGKRILSNEYAKIPLKIMIDFSQKKEVKYSETLLKEISEISDKNVNKAFCELSAYVDKCKKIRNDYIKKYNQGERGLYKKYIDEVNNIYYKDFIERDLLHILRREFFHWSSNASDGIVHYPIIKTAQPYENRKRYIIDG